MAMSYLSFLCLTCMQMKRTALHKAATSGNTGMVEFLMANFNTNMDAKDIVSEASVRSSALMVLCGMQTVWVYSLTPATSCTYCTYIVLFDT